MEGIGKAVERAAEALSDRLPSLVFTGAGISVESGIPPFRGPGGLWTRYDPIEYGHIETFNLHPERSWEMLRTIIGTSLGAHPNEAHLAIARMEKRGIAGPVVTQNVDGLHGEAGTIELHELHGNARRIYCPGCHGKEELTRENALELDPVCACGVWKRPDIVFFGEQLPEKALKGAMDAAARAGSIIVIGTSGVVYPASLIPQIVHQNGGKVVEINTVPSEYTGWITDVFIEASAAEGVSALEKALMTPLGQGI